MSRKIEQFKDYYGEWEVIKVDGEVVYEGHGSDSGVWTDILVDYFDAKVEVHVNEDENYEQWWEEQGF